MVARFDSPNGPIPWVRPAFRRTMLWQAAASLLVALVAGFAAGRHGFLSAMLGGGIGVAGVLAFALASRRRIEGSGNAMRVALRAEAIKMLVIVVLLWLAFVAYHGMVVLAFMGAFAVSVLLSGLAFAVSGDDQLNSSRV